MKLKKLPIGIQTFQKIRDAKENYLYIDKTDIALELIQSSSYIFLSRPRRFGKSLFMDTLQEIFQGNKELFEGLYIYDKWDWDVKYPVIKLTMDFDFLILDNFNQQIKNRLMENAYRLNIELEDEGNNGILFSQLIQKTSEKYKQNVVILIDEWDKPFRECLLEEDRFDIHNELLFFYSVTKNCDEYIKFMFTTGVHPIKGSMLWGFNHIIDDNLFSKYGNVYGFTQENIENEFLPYLEGVDLEKLKSYYKGYNFAEDDLYNPYDILCFIDNKKLYNNYWFNAEAPSFLIKLIGKNNYFFPQLVNLLVGGRILNSFEANSLDFEVVLYQAGYLTIDEMMESPFGGIQYRLKLPNKEVQIALNDILLENLTNKKDIAKYKLPVYNALIEANLEDLEIAIVSIFASIADNNFTNNNFPYAEGYYASVIFSYFQSLGCDIISQYVTSKGRIDLTIKINKLIYILGFKMGDEDAMAQIKEKNYADKYLSLKQDIYLVGINFDENKRNISKFEWEKLRCLK
ncbi:MAG: AAA family ATPase [Sulfurovum sp.]|nr:AAA family ATPase [Sulfurovaceae bacterium]